MNGESRPVPAAGLHVFVRSGPWLLALATDRLERVLALGDESWPLGGPGVEGNLGPVRLEGELRSAWDLGALLGLSVEPRAWALLRLPWDPQPLPLALRLGACVGVGRLPAPELPLPAGAFRARSAALRGVYPAPAEDLVGLVVDPVRLWTGVELGDAEDALARGAAS